MKTTDRLITGYEETKIIRYGELTPDFPHAVAYDELPSRKEGGVLKANLHLDGKLTQVYTEYDNHVGVIAATRLGKTTSYVIPTIISFARMGVKRSMIISDPKGELYRQTAATLRGEGYRVLLLNFRDYNHSECWNPLTPIYRKYRSVFEIYSEVEVVETENGMRNMFGGKIYEDQTELDDALELRKRVLIEDVGNDIDNIALMISPTLSTKDPYWEDSARELVKAFLWGMLEDSRDETRLEGHYVTEDTYSFSTMLTILTTFNGVDDSDFDGGYFSNREKTSRAYALAKQCILENGKVTKQCIVSTFNSKISVYRESAMRLITSCNSFDMDILTGDDPIAIYIDYRDELKVHFQVISLFIQDAYRRLIAHATVQERGRRKIPFYFILDEFGNFPAMKDFETTISACAGRNIFFILIIQSYAQLNNVYGEAVSEIIRDNLNVHVFFGSNNPETLEEFSRECGEHTRISPLSALTGRGSEIEAYQLETIKLIPKSVLAHFAPGECIVTEANSGYVLFSKLERFYLCKEFGDLPLADERVYSGPVSPFDKRFSYEIVEKKKKGFFDI